MDPAAHERLRSRIRQIIAERNGIHLKPERHHEGGFLHLLPMAAAALPSLIDAGKHLFGSGKHRPDAKTRKPNAHAQLVRKIMAEAKAKGKPMSLPEASALAKKMRDRKK